MYRAEVEFFDQTLNPPHGAWKPKAGPQGTSTFFPDHWTPAQVDAAIPGAFRHQTPVPNPPHVDPNLPPQKWRGEHNGITIEGFYNKNPPPAFTHGWPVL